MWLATKYGFYSIVQNEQGAYYIRARVRKDLQNLLEASGLEVGLHSWSPADYHYRIMIGPKDLLKVILTLTATLDYPDFKNCVTKQADQRDKLDAYDQMWAMMAKFECEEAVSCRLTTAVHLGATPQ